MVARAFPYRKKKLLLLPCMCMHEHSVPLLRASEHSERSEHTVVLSLTFLSIYMFSSKYGFGQSMVCLGQSMDLYFERAIHELSKHKMAHRGVLEQGISFPYRNK